MARFIYNTPTSETNAVEPSRQEAHIHYVSRREWGAGERLWVYSIARGSFGHDDYSSHLFNETGSLNARMNLLIVG